MADPAGFPTLADVKAWLNLTDPIDDTALNDGLHAAQANMTRRLAFPVTDTGVVFVDDDLRLACMLRTARYLARRNSPDGLVGFAEFGPARVARLDADIDTLERPYLKFAFA